MPERAQQRKRLISLLQADFDSGPHIGSGSSALSGFLSHARSTEEIDERLASDENVELGQAVERLLEPAPVTESMKEFIADQVRKAHAWRTNVDEVVSPDRLGLVSGEGIFDPEQARQLEAQVLRGYAFDITHRYLTVVKAEGDAEPQLLLTGIHRPSDYRQELGTLDNWTSDYQATYDEDPFGQQDKDMYLDAAGTIALPQDMSWLVQRLRDLRDSE